MAEPFLAQISMVGFTYPPVNWVNCDGQLIAVSQNAALYSLLGTNYGGDGRTTFGIPDLRGRVPIGFGTLQTGGYQIDYDIGQSGGAETVTLDSTELPAHRHAYGGNRFGTGADITPNTDEVFSTENPAGGLIETYCSDPSGNYVAMAPDCVAVAGGGQPHDNIQPSIVIRYIIATSGLYPPRN